MSHRQRKEGGITSPRYVVLTEDEEEPFVFLSCSEQGHNVQTRAAMLVCADADRLLSPGLCLRAGPEFTRLGGGQTEQRRCRWSRFCYVGNITSILNHFLTWRTNTLDFREREKTFIGWMNKTQTDKAKVCFSFHWIYFLKAVQASRCSFPLWRGHFSSRSFIT